MNPTTDEQLTAIKRTLSAILATLDDIANQLAAEPDNKAEFDQWCNAFDQRWANRKQDAYLEEARPEAEDYTIESDPSANNHPAAWR